MLKTIKPRVTLFFVLVAGLLSQISCAHSTPSVSKGNDAELLKGGTAPSSYTDFRERLKALDAKILVDDGFEQARFTFASAFKREVSESGRSIITVRNTKLQGDPWNVNIRVDIEQAFRPGEQYFLLYEAKTLYAETESQEGQVGLLVEHRTNYRKQLNTTMKPSDNWRTYGKAFVAQFATPENSSTIGFNFGSTVQTIQLRNLTLYRLPDSVSKQAIDALQTPISYIGSNADHPWRAKAKAMIEKYRTANWKPQFAMPLKSENFPIEIRLEQKAHLFGFGTAVASRYFAGDKELADLSSRKSRVVNPSQKEREQYLAILEEYFRHNTIENALKWPSWRHQRDMMQPFNTIAWHNERQIPLRGHNVIWPGWNQWEQGKSWDFTPRFIYENRDDKAFLRKEIEAHFKDILTATKGKLVDWDVVNEPRVNHSIMDVLGWEAMAEWFCMARRYAPDTKLYLNDYGMLPAGGNQKNLDTFIEHVKLIQRYPCKYGKTIDGVGLQGHFGENPTSPETLWKLFDKLYDATGLPIKVTEFDIETSNEQYQANYTRDFYTAAFAHPAVEAIIIWGFWEGAIWKPSAAMWRKDWSIKPNGEAMRNLVYKDWRTSLKLTINNERELESLKQQGLKVFQGDYLLSVNSLQDGKRTEIFSDRISVSRKVSD